MDFPIIFSKLLKDITITKISRIVYISFFIRNVRNIANTYFCDVLSELYSSSSYCICTAFNKVYLCQVKHRVKFKQEIQLQI